MKPAPFAYLRPDTLAGALAALAEHGEEARPLAGGQSLVPMLALRLARPSLVIDLNRIPDLAGIAETSEEIRIGAMTRQAALLAHPAIRKRMPLLARALGFVGHPPTRARGTIGGSLAHADPAAELPVAMVALDARLVLTGRAGEREVGAADFFRGTFATDLRPGELLAEIRIPVAGVGRRLRGDRAPAWRFRACDRCRASRTRCGRAVQRGAAGARRRRAGAGALPGRGSVAARARARSGGDRGGGLAAAGRCGGVRHAWRGHRLAPARRQRAGAAGAGGGRRMELIAVALTVNGQPARMLVEPRTQPRRRAAHRARPHRHASRLRARRLRRLHGDLRRRRRSAAASCSRCRPRARR